MKRFFTFLAALTITVALSAQTAEYEIIPVTMSDLVITTQNGYETLEASYPDMALSVTLNVYPDGKLKEDSQVKHGNNLLPIVEGSMQSSYDETNGYQYTGLLVVDMGDNFLMGIELTLYSASATIIDVTINDAEITVDKLDDGMGGTYQLITVSSLWNGHTLLVEGVQTKHEGYLQITETFKVEEEEVYNVWISMAAVVTTVDNVLTITGLFKHDDSKSVYNVTISGVLPADISTNLDNSQLKNNPKKQIINGQLIIINNGVQCNAQGQVIK
jgi:hypothetical protein